MTITNIPFPVLVGFAVALTGAEVLVLQQPLIAANPNFGFIVILDLAVVAPIVFFLLVRRRRPLEWRTLVSYMVFGGFVSALLLRDAQIGRALIVLEFLSLAFFATKIAPFLSRVRGGLRAGEPLEQTLQRSLEAAYGGSLAMPVLRLALTEVFLIYYGVFGSFRRTPPERPDIFSYHRSQDLTMSFALMLVVALETVPLHFLIHQWSAVAAWLLTGLSLYTLLWLLGDYQALRLKPIAFTTTHLRLYTGLRWQANIALDAVVEIVSAEPKASCTCLNTALSQTPQFQLHLKHPVSVFGLFGRRTDVTCIGVYVDDPKGFQARIQQAITKL